MIIRYVTLDEFDAYLWANAAEREHAEVISITYAPDGWRVFARGQGPTRELHARIMKEHAELTRDVAVREVFKPESGT